MQLLCLRTPKQLVLSILLSDFYDEFQPLYIGKSITLKKRVLSHFQDTSSKELKISQNIHYIQTIQTGSELAALVLEAKLIKQQQPLYNRRLRRVSQYALLVHDNDGAGYGVINVRAGSITDKTDLSSIYGVFETRTKAKQQVIFLTRLFELCPKLMGVEKTNGACFSYSLGKCKGACINEESTELYNRRLDIALEKSKIATWPYDGAVVITLGSDHGYVEIENWLIFNSLDDVS